MYIPIYPVSAIGEARPNYLLILPWNLTSNIVGQIPAVAGFRMVTPGSGVEALDLRGEEP